MYGDPSSLAELFARQPLSGAAVAFAPAWLLALYAGLRIERGGVQPLGSRLRGLARLRRPERGSIFLAFLLWAALSATRSFRFFEELAVSHGPDSREFFAVAVENLGAGVVTCWVLCIALTLRRHPSWKLGLQAGPHFVSVLVLLGVLLDTALLLAVMAFYSYSPRAGAPLPMSLVSWAGW